MGLRRILADPVTHPLTSANFSSGGKKKKKSINGARICRWILGTQTLF